MTQQDYFDAIGRAGLVWSDKVLANINKEKQGCFPSWVSIFCELKKIEVAEYFFRRGDYATSAGSALSYSYMMQMAGTQYSDAEVDPNAQLPGVIVIIQVDGAETITYTYTQDDLIFDDNTNTWYLDYKDEDGELITTTPFNITSETDDHVYPVAPYLENDDAWDFPRIYGFPPATTTQLIKVHTI